MGYSLLIADDSLSELYLLAEFFAEAGFKVYQASTCAEAIAITARYVPDCYLLDYHMDIREGAEDICAFIRSNEKTHLNPVIIRSGDESLTMRSYDGCEADNYVDKEKSNNELLAIVKRQIRRYEAVNGIHRSADLALDEKNQQVVRQKYPPKQLSPDQFKLFSLLFSRRGRFVSEADICQLLSIRSDDQERNSTLKSLVCRLRERLGPQLARRIKNQRKKGWTYVQPRGCGRESSRREGVSA